jgi:hypothetical protein
VRQYQLSELLLPIHAGDRFVMDSVVLHSDGQVSHRLVTGAERQIETVVS